MNIGFIAHFVAALAFLSVTLLLLQWRSRASADDLLTLAAAATAVWAGVAAYFFWLSISASPTVSLLEVARDAAWFAYFIGILLRGRAEGERVRPYLLAGVAIICVTAVGLGLFLAADMSSDEPQPHRDVAFVGYLVLALVGLALIENIHRNTPDNKRWNINLVCLAGGGIFAYDFFLYSHALLFRQIDPNLLVARGFTTALIAPLVIMSEIRNRSARTKFIISRRLAFHTATLMGSGVYLLLMAAAGYYIRFYGGSWGAILQAAFLFGAIILLIVSLFSGSVRAHMRTFVEKNFFHYKYDYREEWLRFIRTLSGEAGISLPIRVVEAVGHHRRQPGRRRLVASPRQALRAGRILEHVALGDQGTRGRVAGETAISPPSWPGRSG